MARRCLDGWVRPAGTRCGAGGWASDVLVAGLTLAGEHPEGKRLLAWGMGYFRRNYLPGWQLTGGAWQGGGVAYFGGAAILPLALACWESATEDGIFHKGRLAIQSGLYEAYRGNHGTRTTASA